MKLLLDSHILIWTLNGDDKLPSKVPSLIYDENNSVYYSSVSIWELAIKHNIRPDNIRFDARQVSDLSKQMGYIELRMKEQHVFALETLTRFENAPDHKDPFDRMLIAQAKAEDMKLLTCDSKIIRGYNEDCILFV